MPHDVTSYLVRAADSVRSVMSVIERTRGGVALVVDKRGKLVGTITDGNIRRYILADGDLSAVCRTLVEQQPVTVPLEASHARIRQIMESKRLLHLPVVDKDGRPHTLWELRDLLSGSHADSVVAVIMAGGEGKRLRPLTETIPKPMVEVRGQPVLERIVENMLEAGVTKIYLAVRYRAEIIESYFGTGERFGAGIRYLREPKKLGTAGALTLLPKDLMGPIILINGDVVTQVAYGRLLDWHYEHHCALTVAAVKYTTRVPYGVLKRQGQQVVGITEKPEHSFLCGAGMYVLEPPVRRLLTADTAIDMNQVISTAIREGLAVSAFPVHEEWFDIGRREDLERAAKMEASA